MDRTPRNDAKRSMTGQSFLWLGVPAAAYRFDEDELDVEERTRYARLRNGTRRREFEVSRALRVHVAAWFAREGGAGATVGLRETLSHSGGQAALLQTPVRAGVDLEVHRTREYLSLARSTFDVEEIRLLESLGEAARVRAFYALWTMKEALAKALGLELLVALNRCRFTLLGERWLLHTPTAARCVLRVFEPRPGMSLAAAWIDVETAPELRTMSWPPQQEESWPVIAAAETAPPQAAGHTAPA